MKWVFWGGSVGEGLKMAVVLRCSLSRSHWGRGLQEEVPSWRQEQHAQRPYSAETEDQAGEKKQ